jgi:LacI family transcriptional regulator
MKSLNPKIRIKDIANLAGVSEGTVDRVLHQRGDVSAKSLEAVNKVLEELEYSPNIYARSLASKKQYRFVCMFPEHQSSGYWQMVEDGFKQAAQEYIHHNVILERTLFNQFDNKSFTRIAELVLQNPPDAVLITPIFKVESLNFTNELSKQGIPFSFIDSMLEEADYLTYYGQNSFQSGYIAAKLLSSSLPVGKQVLVIRTQSNGTFSNQTILRHNGFMHYMNDNGLTHCIDLIDLEMIDEDEQANTLILKNAFNKYQNIKAIITFNSKAYRLAKYLEEHDCTKVCLIGYDLLDLNVEYLKRGVISYLLAQRPNKQAYYSVRDMCKLLIFKQDIQKTNYVPIDIILKENIDYYLDFPE